MLSQSWREIQRSARISSRRSTGATKHKIDTPKHSTLDIGEQSAGLHGDRSLSSGANNVSHQCARQLKIVLHTAKPRNEWAARYWFVLSKWCLGGAYMIPDAAFPQARSEEGAYVSS